MPKIYFRSKDVKDIDVLKWAGTCYTRTGEYASVSKDSNISLNDVEAHYGGCTSCAGGQVTLSAGAVSSLIQSPSFQVKADISSGESATLSVQTVPGSSCEIVLSASDTGNLIFDASSAGNGPHEFTSIPETFSFEGCSPKIIYDVTLAGLGSYYITFEQQPVPVTPTPTPTGNISIQNPTPTPTPTTNSQPPPVATATPTPTPTKD